MQTIQTYTSSVTARVTDQYSFYMAKDEVEKLVIEATANENWNVSNSKQIQIADASYNVEHAQKILKIIFVKLEAPSPQWRRVLKTLTVVEFLLKNGSPILIQQLQQQIFKISSLHNFTYSEENIDKGKPIRDKVALCCDLLSNNELLHHERVEAYEYRKKFYPGTGPSAEQAGLGNNPTSNYSPQQNQALQPAAYQNSNQTTAYGTPQAQVSPYGSTNSTIASQSMSSEQFNQNQGAMNNSNPQQNVYQPYSATEISSYGSSSLYGQSIASNSMSSSNVASNANQSSISSIKDSVVSSVTSMAGKISSTVGLSKEPPKGLLGASQLSNQGFGATNYAPPLSMSSEQFSNQQWSNNNSSQNQIPAYNPQNSYQKKTATMNSNQETTILNNSQNLIKAQGPWSSSVNQAQQSTPKQTASANAKNSQKDSGQQNKAQKTLFNSETNKQEDSSDDYGSEDEKTKPNAKSQATNEGPTAQTEDVADLLDMGSKDKQQENVSTAFSFMNQEATNQNNQQNPIDQLINMNGTSVTQNQTATTQDQNSLFDLLNSQQTQVVSNQSTDLFANLTQKPTNCNNSQTQSAKQSQDTSDIFNLQSSTPQTNGQVINKFDSGNLFDGLQTQEQQKQEAQQPKKDIFGKNLKENDTWAKGRDLVDLKNLGKEDEEQKKPSYMRNNDQNQGVYIKNTNNSGNFQPMQMQMSQEQQMNLLLQNQMMQLQLNQANQGQNNSQQLNQVKIGSGQQTNKNNDDNSQKSAFNFM